MQNAVVLDPYAKAVVGRRKFGELGEVRCRAILLPDQQRHLLNLLCMGQTLEGARVKFDTVMRGSELDLPFWFLRTSTPGRRRRRGCPAPGPSLPARCRRRRPLTGRATGRCTCRRRVLWF